MYEGGIFIIELKFPRDYPNNPPEIYFKTPIYHFDVSSRKFSFPLGRAIIYDFYHWNFKFYRKKVENVLIKIIEIFSNSNIPSRIFYDKLEEYKYNKSLYEEKVKYFTTKYANPNYCDIEKDYGDVWDFSYP